MAPPRRMRCSRCCLAKYDFDKANLLKTDPNQRVCTDCSLMEKQQQQQRSPHRQHRQKQESSHPPQQQQHHHHHHHQQQHVEEESCSDDESEDSVPMPYDEIPQGFPQPVQEEEEEEDSPPLLHPQDERYRHHTEDVDGAAAAYPSVCPVLRMAPPPSNGAVRTQFHRWLREQNGNLTDEMVKYISDLTLPFVTETTPESFAEAVVRAEHHRLMRRIAGPETMSDQQIHTMFESIKSGEFHQTYGLETANSQMADHTAKKAASAAASTPPRASHHADPIAIRTMPSRSKSTGSRRGMITAQTPKIAPGPRLPPFNAESYVMHARHIHEDRYFANQQDHIDGTDFVPDLKSKQVLTGGFTGEQNFIRVSIRSDADYQQSLVHEPLHQGGAKIVPEKWSDFKTIFSDMDVFGKYFLHDEKNNNGLPLAPPPSSYPDKCESDEQKIEYIMGFWKGPNLAGKLARAMEDFDDRVSADILVVPPPPPGGKLGNVRFQPAFAGMFLFYYDDPEDIGAGQQTKELPFMYISIASSGSGTPLSLYTNKVTAVPAKQAGTGSEPVMRLLQTRTGGKFTPTSSSDNYYSHGMKVYPGTGKMFFLIDVYYGATPPVFFWEPINNRNRQGKYAPHIRVEVKVDPMSAAGKSQHQSKPADHLFNFVKSTAIKGLQMERFTAPYFPSVHDHADIIRLVFSPDGGKSSYDNIFEKLGLKFVSDLIKLVQLGLTNKELGIDKPPQVGPHKDVPLIKPVA